jgi:quinol monooxygenase YgiN
MHVICVTFTIKPDHAKAFEKLVLENAAASLADEPGCQRFDVCRSDDPCVIFLYEIYDDKAAFDDHLTRPHFRHFNDETAPMVDDKVVSTYALMN